MTWSRSPSWDADRLQPPQPITRAIRCAERSPSPPAPVTIGSHFQRNKGLVLLSAAEENEMDRSRYGPGWCGPQLSNELGG